MKENSKRIVPLYLYCDSPANVVQIFAINPNKFLSKATALSYFNSIPFS